MANYNTVSMRAALARRLPDPNFKSIHNMERHLFVVQVGDVPADLPLDPNARSPKTSKRVYQKVRESLLNRDCEPGTFHLKNKGITIVAESVRQVNDNVYEIKLLNGVHGIVDGGHTHSIIASANQQGETPENQFVNIEVRTGMPDLWIPEIAGGLNTSVQVQDMSLDHLAGNFDWIKEELRKEKYYSKIAWSENEPGEFDARDIIALMAMFSADLHQNEGDDHPVYAYEKKSIALKAFEKHPAFFRNLRPILREILTLHDIVRKEYLVFWNKSGGNSDGGIGKARALSWTDKRDKGQWDFIFTGEKADYRMANGALYPILAAFRWHVEKDMVTGQLQWRGGFAQVVGAWREAAVSLLKATHEMSESLARNPQSVGKSRPHWSNLHNLVAKRDLQQRTA